MGECITSFMVMGIHRTAIEVPHGLFVPCEYFEVCKMPPHIMQQGLFLGHSFLLFKKDFCFSFLECCDDVPPACLA